MLMTEEEAKTKECRATGAAVSLIRAEQAAKEIGSVLSIAAPLCVGSQCMMWRWERGTHTSLVTTRDELMRLEDGTVWFRPIPPDGAGWLQTIDRENTKGKPLTPISPGTTSWYRRSEDRSVVWGNPARGFCGLAGKPEIA